MPTGEHIFCDSQAFLGAFRSHPHDDSSDLIRGALAHSQPTVGTEQCVNESEHLVLASRHWIVFPGAEEGAFGLTGCTLGDSSEDTEPKRVASIAATVQKRGESTLSEVTGSFAAALTGTREGVLIGDRFGQQQLFFTRQLDRLWFSTDLRLLLSLSTHRRVRVLGLLEWIHHGNPLAPGTFFDGLFTLPGGSALRYDFSTECTTVQRRFEPIDAVSADLAAELTRCPTAELQYRLERQLKESIQRSIGGKRSVSILLSGGVDSSLLTAMAARHTTVQPIHVEVKECSERRHAAAVAKHVGVDLIETVFGESEFRSNVCDAVYSTCSPIIQKYWVALQYVAAQGLVPNEQRIIDGVAADASYAGNTHNFRSSMMNYLFCQLTRMPASCVLRLIRRLREDMARIGMDTRVSGEMHGLHRVLFARGIERSLLRDRINERLCHLPPGPQREIAVAMLEEFYDQGRMAQQLRTVAGAAGSDLVLPFLDHGLMRLSANLPMSAKIRWDWRRLRPATKWLEKRVAAQWLPASAVYRPKVGFGMPAGRWIGGMPEAWLRDSWISEQFCISRPTLERLIAHSGETNDRVFLITTEIWGRLFSREQPLESVRGEWLEAAF